MSGDVIGPGMGAFIGLTFAEGQNNAAFAAERDRLRKKLRDANDQALAGQACADAARAILNEVVGELAAEEAGKKVVRRLSDPANVKGRNEAFVATAEGQLTRLSESRLRFTDMSKAITKTARAEVGEVIKSGSGLKLMPRT